MIIFILQHRYWRARFKSPHATYDCKRSISCSEDEFLKFILCSLSAGGQKLLCSLALQRWYSQMAAGWADCGSGGGLLSSSYNILEMQMQQNFFFFSAIKITFELLTFDIFETSESLKCLRASKHKRTWKNRGSKKYSKTDMIKE